jgi:fused signal recognition particle receptor
MGFMSLFGKKKDGDEPKRTFFEKVKNAVKKTNEVLNMPIEDLVRGKKEISPEMLEELEVIMIGADIGVNTTTEILDTIRDQVSRQTLQDPADLRNVVKAELRKILTLNEAPAREVADGGPFVIFMVGVNGVGKTTTIGKLASRFKKEGKTVMLCAADTFRAAAIEQLEVWSKRSDVPLIRQNQGSDPSAVLHDALRSAKAKDTNIVIVDTAGRLHTKHNLMNELEKMTRVAKKEVPTAPHEVLLVMDATTGQNGLMQAKEFTKSSGVTGIVLTKLDGTAKGGVVIAIARELKIPIRFVGVGEQIDDLIEFSADDFVEGLFAA